MRLSDCQVLIKVLTRMESKPSKRVWSSIVAIQRDISRHCGRSDIAVEVLLLAARELNSSDPIPLRYLKQDNTIILDWVTGVHDLTIERLREMTFRTAHLRATRWHQENPRGRYSWATNSNNYEWTSKLNVVIIDEWKVEALNSSAALREEGRTMDHCVATYDSKCNRNESRIFSVQDKSGLHIGTLELVPESDGWKKRQLHGPENLDVPSKAITVANKFVKLYNEEP